MKKMIALSLSIAWCLGLMACSQDNRQTDTVQADTIQASDDGTTIRDTSPGTEEILGATDTNHSGEDIRMPRDEQQGGEDVTVPQDTGKRDIQQPEGLTVAGRVWGYSVATGKDYTYFPMAGITISTHGLAKDLTTTSVDKDCATWWNDKQFACGSFVFKGIPRDGRTFYLTATGMDGYPDCISQDFTANDSFYTFMVMAGQALINGVSTLWHIPWNDNRGLVIGLIADGVDPQQSTPVTGFIGDATVAIKPVPDNKDFQVVYLDAQDIKNTGRKSTDPAQSLFFLINVSPAQAKTYTLTVKHKTYTFPATTFHVESGKVTYLLIRRDK